MPILSLVDSETPGQIKLTEVKGIWKRKKKKEIGAIKIKIILFVTYTII